MTILRILSRPNARRIAAGLGALALAASTGAALAAAQSGEVLINDKPLKEKDKYVLLLSGSNSVGGELGPALVKAWLKEKKGATNLQVRQPDRTQPEFEVSGRIGAKPVVVLVRARGTGTGFDEAQHGGVDIVMASRPVNAAEIKSLKGVGDFGARAAEHVVAYDGITMIVARPNPVKTLSVKQLHDLFTCQIKDWDAVGGRRGRPIHLYARDDNSGTYDGFKQKVLNGEALCPGGGGVTVARYNDSEKLERDVAADPDGIGFVAMPYVKTTRALAVSSGNAEAFTPTAFTVRTERYALSRRLFLYAPPERRNATAADFIRFAESDDAQKVVRSLGFVDLTWKDPAEAPSAARCRLSTRFHGDPQTYCRILAKGGVQPVTFKFLSGKDELDSLGTADLLRLIGVLGQKPSQQILLVGHADSSGAYAKNCRLSAQRAKAVQQALKTVGVTRTRTEGVCDEIPVRSNDTEQGRADNRRVEVFFQ